ncbi:sulfatase, partial [uncultured Fusobacterium sp.]|uniref:sulfatase family protein n=1 Tax=uncultured Fusobacterium sp. TaxID=159267 RepID=UPI0025F2C20B
NMDMFCRESTYCDHAFSTFPVCSPHRASMMTGKYPLSLGVFTNCKNGLSMRLRDEEVGIGQVLKDAGYQTGYIGKWHLDEPEQNNDPNPVSGACDWDAFTPPGPRRHGFDYWYSYGTYDVHLDPHYWADTPEQIKPGCWSPEFETDKALEYMEGKKQQEEPFALFVSYNPPHLPYELVPDKYYEKYKDMPVHFRENVPKEKRTPEMETITRQYFAAVSGVDEQFGRLLEFLKENGMEEDTIVVLSADHGEMLCSHRLWSKHVWFEESVGIPFLIKYGDRFIRGNTNVVLNGVDIMPTILSLMNLPIPESIQGIDLKEVILNGNDIENYAIMAGYPGQIRAIEEFKSYGKDNTAFGWRAIRTKQHTYVINRGYTIAHGIERLLYDNINDPYQMNPIKLNNCSENEIATELEAKLKEWAIKYKDKFEF